MASMIDTQVLKLPGFKGTAARIAALCVLSACCTVAEALSLSQAITHLWKGVALASQTAYIAAFAVAFIIKNAVVFAQDSIMDAFAYARAAELREGMLRALFNPSRHAETRSTGSTVAAVIDGIDETETYFRIIVIKLVALAVIPPILLVTAFALDWVSGLIMLVTFPAIIMFMVILGKTAQDRAARQHEEFSRLSGHFIDTLRGIETLRFFGVTKRYEDEVFATSERFREATVKTLATATLSSLVLDLFATLGIAGVALMLGMRLIDGSILLFPALAVLILAPEYYRPIRSFASDFHASLDGRNALARAQAVIQSEAPAAVAAELAPWTNESVLQVNHVGVNYDAIHALSDICFTAQGTCTYGIIGPSGAGKSTLAAVLAGFLEPDEGAFVVGTVDTDAAGNNSADAVVGAADADAAENNGTSSSTLLPSLCEQAWQKQVAYIPQNPYIFHDTLRENLRFYAPHATDEAVLAAIHVLGLDSLLEELDDGLDTLIGDGARALSGGQAQRVALARAMLDDSRRILVFDEPTAHLDIETEMELKACMLRLMEGRLVFFATHRLHWMRNMDHIFVLEDGRITDEGSLEELRQNSVAFARLIASSRMDAPCVQTEGGCDE